jgi:tetratricopeptide (TPR) repeat protein
MKSERKTWKFLIIALTLQFSVILNSLFAQDGKSAVNKLTITENKVTVSKLQINLPTYQMGPDEVPPYFKEFNVPGLSFFRGSRSVYPYTFQNNYRPGRVDKNYEVVRLENDFISVDIIPELRGRIQGAIDKRNGWEFLYYNHVIKPAEIAVRSAWISGGMEYNHPGGHGYTQLNKISYTIKEEADGSKSVVVAEIEPVSMMKWEYVITLRPDKLYLELTGRFISTAPFRVPFTSSNNAAVHATDEMELIYPAETYVADHARRNPKKWPDYNKSYPDNSWFKNVKSTLSVFVEGTGLLQDSWGAYSHDKNIDAGTVIVADHRTAPGKKYFTWGSHDFGRMWDHYLSDNDGPYVEMQLQAYYVNLQYGYAVLDPFEVKEFTSYWYPVKNTGGFVKATKDLVINLIRQNENNIRLSIQPTASFPETKVSIFKNNVLIQQFTEDLVIGSVYNKEIKIRSLPADTLKIVILDKNQKNILDYFSKIRVVEPEIFRLPALKLKEMTIDQLFNKGISNYEDIYGPDAVAAFEEILSRDSLESRTNREMGIVSIKQGQYEQAVKYLRKSLINDHFRDCYTTYYLLGISYIELADLNKADEYLTIASREKDMFVPSMNSLAKIAILKKYFPKAINILSEAKISNDKHPALFNLLSYSLRKRGRIAEAKQINDESFKSDPLNFIGFAEKLFLSTDKEPVIKEINDIFDRKDLTFIGSQLYIETAQFYIGLADYEAAIDILNIAENHFKGTVYTYPFIDYCKGYCLFKLNKTDEAKVYFKQASERVTLYVFPYSPQTITVLNSALSVNDNDPVACMYLGDLLYYLHRQDEAITLWEKSAGLGYKNSVLYRNLGLANYVQTRTTGKTTPLLETAFELDRNDSRIFAELESVYLINKSVDKLLSLYENNMELIKTKPELALNCIDLFISKAKFGEALSVIENTYFSASENNTNKPVVHARYAEIHIGLGEKYFAEKKYDQAIEEYKKSLLYPDYLNEKKVNNPVEVRTNYLLGKAYQQKNDKNNSGKYFKLTLENKNNDISESVIYKAMALKETGKKDEAIVLVNELLGKISHGKRSSAETDYIQSKAYDFLGDQEKALQFMDSAVRKNYNVYMNVRFNDSYFVK